MKMTFAVLSVCLFAALAACNTIEGAGRDVESGGAAISNTAREAERELSQ